MGDHPALILPYDVGRPHDFNLFDFVALCALFLYYDKLDGHVLRPYSGAQAAFVATKIPAWTVIHSSRG